MLIDGVEVALNAVARVDEMLVERQPWPRTERSRSAARWMPRATSRTGRSGRVRVLARRSGRLAQDVDLALRSMPSTKRIVSDSPSVTARQGEASCCRTLSRARWNFGSNGRSARALDGDEFFAAVSATTGCCRHRARDLVTCRPCDTTPPGRIPCDCNRRSPRRRRRRWPVARQRSTP